MFRSKKRWAKGASIPFALLTGWITAWVTTMLLTLITTFLVAGEHISESAMAPAAVITISISALISATVAAENTAEKRMMVCLINGCVYFLSLICCTALFFDGTYQGIGSAALTVIGCSLVSGFLSIRQKRQKNQYLKKHHKH